MGACIRVSAMVTAMPEKKNGTPRRITSTTSGSTRDTRASVSGGTGTTSVARCVSGMATAIASVDRTSICGAASPRACSPLRKTNTAPLAMPSIASETARKDRWYQVRTERSRVLRISTRRVANVVSARPGASHGCRRIIAGNGTRGLGS
jgi:hypothetical protein